MMLQHLMAQVLYRAINDMDGGSVELDCSRERRWQYSKGVTLNDRNTRDVEFDLRISAGHKMSMNMFIFELIYFILIQSANQTC